MLAKFLYRAFSQPLLTLRLARPGRIKKAILFLFSSRANLSELYRRSEEIYAGSNKGSGLILEKSCTKTKPKKTILIFPLIDWEHRHQRPQHLALHLARRGYRVFYFSTIPLMAKESYRITGQFEENVHVCRLRAGGFRIDDIHRDVMSPAARDGYLASLQQLMKDMEIESPITILHHPYWTPVAQQIPGARIGYDCMDHHRGFYEETATGMEPSELSLLKAADFVVASSVYLRDKFSAVRDVTLIPNGCEYEVFSSVAPPPRGSMPVAGYIGAIAKWFDINLLIEVAQKLPGWMFVLVGTTAGCATWNAKRIPNIKIVGEVPYTDVPAQLERFDVCMIPFRITELTKATNPVKVYEYLASGRPVVSTPIPEVKVLGGRVKIASTANDFATKLQESLEVSRSVSEGWRRWAAAQDWSYRAAAFEEAMLGTSPSVSCMTRASSF
jgi:glycosyltransferase involved in cell wall biosynthesis